MSFVWLLLSQLYIAAAAATADDDDDEIVCNTPIAEWAMIFSPADLIMNPIYIQYRAISLKKRSTDRCALSGNKQLLSETEIALCIKKNV